MSTKANNRFQHYRNQKSGDGSWADFAGDVYSGLAVGFGHFRWFVSNKVSKAASLLIGGDLSGKGSHRRGNTDRNNPPTSFEEGKEKEGLKVVGVGYGRTGTYSLALALDELGFPTLHTQHLYENKDIFDMMVENIFYRSIQEDEVVMGNPDFDLLLKGGFTATMDLPFALYYSQIHENYPDCKFILTVRENSEVWFRSWDVLTRSITQPAQYGSFFFTHVRKLGYYMRWLFSIVNSDKKFLSHPFPLPPQNKAKSISSYERHNQLVREHIPSTHLLEYNVRQGWEPLCKFLEVPEMECPSYKGIPFPKSNSARAVHIQSISSFMGPLILVGFVFFSLFCLVFRKITGMSVVGWAHYQRRRFLQGVSMLLERRSKRTRRSRRVKMN